MKTQDFPISRFMEDESQHKDFFSEFGYSPLEFETRKFRQHLKNEEKKDK